MASILKVDTIQDQAGNNIISENANVITIGASGDTITVPAGATVSGFTSAGIDDNATSTAITIDSSQNVGIGGTPSFGQLQIQKSGSGNSGGTLVLTNADGSIQDGQTLGNLYFVSLDNTSTSTRGGVASIKATASEDYTSSSGANLSFFTHPESANNDTIDGNTVENFRINAGGNLQVQGTAGLFLSFLNDSNTGFARPSSDTLAINTGGSERMRIDSSGNVGIGTSSPTATLNIQSSTDASIDLKATSGSTQDCFITFNSPDNGFMYLGIDDSEQLFKINNDSALSSANHFVITRGTGNVGIGTSSPTEKLQVNGNIKFGDGHVLGNGTGDNLEIISGTGENITYTSDGGFHTFKNNSGTEYMRINTSGNLLIGNTNNTTLSNLEINDSIGLQSDAFFSVELGKGDTTGGNSTSSITLSYEASWYAAHTMIEVQMFAYNSKYLDHLLGFYTQGSPIVMRNNNNGNTTVTTSFTSTGTYTSIVNHVITFTTNVGYPIVRYKITRGGGTGAGFITKPTITFAH